MMLLSCVQSNFLNCLQLILPRVCHSSHQKNDPPAESMSQARQSKYAHEGYMINSPVREEGLSNQKVSMASTYVPKLCVPNSLFPNYVDEKP